MSLGTAPFSQQTKLKYITFLSPVNGGEFIRFVSSVVPSSWRLRSQWHHMLLDFVSFFVVVVILGVASSTSFKFSQPSLKPVFKLAH
jgi:hypothetical protein